VNAAPVSNSLSARENPSSPKAFARGIASDEPSSSNPRGKAARRRLSAEKQTEIELLVPLDQEVLLAGYAAELRSRKSAPVMAKGSAEPEPALLQVELIQIAQLDVKPLAEAER